MEEFSRQDRITALGAAVQVYQRSTDLLDDVVAQRLEINRTDLRCLDVLSDGPTSVGQLAVAVALSSAATTTLLDRLERRGLLRRIRDTTDRRKVLVELTEFGQAEVLQCYGPLVTEGSELLQRYSDDQLMLLHDFLVLTTNLNHRHRARIAEESREPA
jgi:DNA-binding MarR family transcriptional regulator